MFDNFLASACSFGLVTIFFCAYSFKYLTLTELPDIQSKLSREQRLVYAINPVVVGFIAVGALLGTLAFSLILFAITFHQEQKRLRREARAAKARRLRYETDNEEAIPTALPAWPKWLDPKGLHLDPKGFHLL